MPGHYLEKRPQEGTDIYVLFDPRDGEVRYVGQTINAEEREKAHRFGHGESSQLAQWKVKLAAVGLRPLMHRLGRVRRNAAQRAERFTIDFCLSSRARLLNWFGSPTYQDGPRRSRLIRRVGFGRVTAKPTKQYRNFLLQRYPQVHAKLFEGNATVSAVPLNDLHLPLLQKGRRLKPYGPAPQVPDEIFGRVAKSYVTVTPNCPFCGAKGTLRHAEPPLDSMTDGQIQDYETGFREYLRCRKCGNSHWQTQAGQTFAILRAKE
jgi:hypothetical protein